MKSVLISIQPYWVFLIIAKVMGWNIGKEKTTEVRKNYPKDENWDKVAKIYCSKDKRSFAKIPKEYQPLMERFLGKVIGEFVCDIVEPYWFMPGDTDIEQYEDVQLSCLSAKEILDYGNGKQLYFWNISNLAIYDEPKPLSVFYKCGALSHEELDETLCGYCSRTDYGKHRATGTPNGVWMCEGRWCGDAYQEYLAEEFALTRPPQSWCHVEELR